MKTTFSASGLSLALMALTIAAAAAQPLPFDDFRQGDLIFQETTGRQSLAVKAATGSDYTHMGIVRLTGGGPVVIEAGRVVEETDIEDFVARGKGGRFAVYRLNGLTEAKAHRIIDEAYKDMDKPYDLYFRLDPAAIYCSELPYRAFKAAGVPIGTVEKVGNLKINIASAVALIDSRWKKHPDCAGGTKEACLKKLDNQDIVTPVSIARDKNLTEVFSNF